MGSSFMLADAFNKEKVLVGAFSGLGTVKFRAVPFLVPVSACRRSHLADWGSPPGWPLLED